MPWSDWLSMCSMSLTVERARSNRDDALLHLLGRDARVVEEHGHDRDVDLRKDVRGHPREGTTPRIAMSIAITMNVYGRRSASRTIHTAGGPPMLGGEPAARGQASYER